MANATSPVAGATVRNGSANAGVGEVRTISIGEALLSQLKERLEAIEAEDAKAEGRTPEPIDLDAELARAKVIHYVLTSDGLQWRRGEPPPNMKSKAYTVFAMFRVNPDDPETDIRVYLIPAKPETNDRLLTYEITRDKIDVICDAFADPEVFISAVADEFLRALGLDEELDEETPEEAGANRTADLFTTPPAPVPG
jgi:hypothetical protein